MTYYIALPEQYVGCSKTEQTLAPEVRHVIKVALALETHPLIVPETHEFLRVAVNVSDTAPFNVHPITITSAVASNQEVLVWRVFSPVVTVFQVLKVLRYARNFLSVNFIHNRHRSGSSFSGCFVPLLL